MVYSWQAVVAIQVFFSSVICNFCLTIVLVFKLKSPGFALLNCLIDWVENTMSYQGHCDDHHDYCIWSFDLKLSWIPGYFLPDCWGAQNRWWFFAVLVLALSKVRKYLSLEVLRLLYIKWVFVHEEQDLRFQYDG